jgi:hypothetical protein
MDHEPPHNEARRERHRSFQHSAAIDLVNPRCSMRHSAVLASIERV